MYVTMCCLRCVIIISDSTWADVSLSVKAEADRTFAVEAAGRVDAMPVQTYVGYDRTLVDVYM